MTVIEDELLVALRDVTGVPELAFDGAPVRLTGGFWAELFSFRLTHAPSQLAGRLVARIMPDAAIAAKETAFQSEVAALGYATPRIHAAADAAHGVGGRAFVVMDMADGKSLLAGLDGAGAIRNLPRLFRRLPLILGEAMARLHRLDPTSVAGALTAAGVPRPDVPAMLTSLRVTAETRGRSDLAAAAAWLQTNAPAAPPEVICHGDLHPFNVLVDDDGAVCVLDWSAALLAPPTYDLGFTSLVLSEPPLVVPRPLRPVVRAAGRALSRRFLRAYARALGVKVDPNVLAWNQSLVCLRALSEAAGWVADGTIGDRGGHPWVLAGDAFAARLTALTGAPVSAR